MIHHQKISFLFSHHKRTIKNNISYIKDMIENIKRIVNEHRTLIVIIIAVLVICFLYWWFCCKDRPVANKVKGGGLSRIVLQLGKELREWIGVFVNYNTQFPFYMLNFNGDHLVDNSNDFMNKFNLLFASLGDKNILETLVDLLMNLCGKNILETIILKIF